MIAEGSISNGFRLLRSERIEEIDSTALTFSHVATRAELIVIQNEDDNKVFMITFRTPPADHTGVSHILEHSVLNGSKKYPVKEPFAELLKSSLYTFLNAMTYPDKTVYPAASRNIKDFHNLMDVYLDAVFNPILSDQTFQQEGWRFVIDQPASALEYSGVVYNEMLGSYSDPETVLIDTMNKAFFPDSVYGFSSGGNPEFIPNLTYDEFVDYHRRYYHPSNSKTLIYGAVDVEPELALLQSYFSRYAHEDHDSSVRSQPRFDAPKYIESRYPILRDEQPAGKAYILKSYLMEHPTDSEYCLGASILSRLLVGTSASPLRKALIDSGLGESTLNYGFEHEIFDTYFGIGLKNTEPDRIGQMEEVIQSTLAKLVRDGIDKRMLEASLNSVEFQLREANFGGYPKGLCYGITMLTSWLYDADPYMHLRYEPILAAIRKQADNGYFESLIQRYLIHNNHQVTITLIPDNRLQEERSKNLSATLDRIKSGLSTAQLEDAIRNNDELRRKQLTPDSPEALAKIPKLSLKDVDKVAENYHFEIISDTKPRLTFSRQPTSGVAYVGIAFDASALSREWLEYLPIFCQITLQVGTHDMDFVDLIQEIDIHTGGISSVYFASPVYQDRDQVNSHVSYSAKCLTSKIPKLVDILGSVFVSCNFDNAKRVGEVIRIAKSKMQSQIVSGGHSFVGKRLNACYSRFGQFREAVSGLSQYFFLETLQERFESDPEAVIAGLKTIASATFNRNLMHVHITGGDAELAALESEMKGLSDRMPGQPASIANYRFDVIDGNEGWIIPSQIQYVGKGVNLAELGHENDGRFEVLNTLLGRDYLWNSVRVRGGAYGCFINLEWLSGNLCCVSYRDPNLEETVTAFDGIGDYLAGLEISDDEFEKLVIGTVGGIDAPKTPDQKGATALNRYLSGISQSDIQRRRDQVLSSRKDDFRDFIDVFKDFARNGLICVVGSEEKLRQCEHRFQSIRNVFR